ncbi:hypothetical protein OIV83_006218 [Microbotryomycetes sp. JL201]|nr:hypothetical protein OIV83_006218 [Microbotryomycetes sp. JL201]
MAHHNDGTRVNQLDEQPQPVSPSSRVFPAASLRRKPSGETAASQIESRSSDASVSPNGPKKLADPRPSPSKPAWTACAPPTTAQLPRRPSLDPLQPSNLANPTISHMEGLPRIASLPASAPSLEQPVTTAQPSLLITRPHTYHSVHCDNPNVHYVVTGTKGDLINCQDEPIHTPGAIQSYGVMIVFEDTIDGRLIVHQVSENSGPVIGIDCEELLTSNSLSGVFAENTLLDIADAIDEFDHLRRRSGEESLQLPVEFDLITPRGQAHASLHRPAHEARRCVLELELVEDERQPATPPPDGSPELDPLAKAASVLPQSTLDASTLSLLQPLLKLEQWKASYAPNPQRNLDALSLMADVNEQLSKCDEIEPFLALVAALFRSVTGYTRSMVYQFDEDWNGQVVAEQVDPRAVVDLYKGLVWPASDIPAQARELYQLNKIRILYDSSAPVARMRCRTKDEAETPLDMTHSVLRAMSPIHIQYLKNMTVKSSMSVSINVGKCLWGLVALHQLGSRPRRPSAPVRRLVKMIADTVSVNLERILLRRKLLARQVVSFSLGAEPSVTNQDLDLLSLFQADSGALVSDGRTKILGSVDDASELIALVDFLKEERIKGTLYTRNIAKDFPQIQFEHGFDTVAGFLAIPLSGSDLVVFARKGMDEEVHWAGNPHYKTQDGSEPSLEPRNSFKLFKELVRGRCRPWSEFELDQARLLASVYGVWKKKTPAESATRLTALLLENASHEARTPLNIIINHLEHALEGDIAHPDLKETLHRSAAASKSLLVAINDLLDLSKAGPIRHLTVNEPVNARTFLQDLTAVFRFEAIRKHLLFELAEATDRVPDVIIIDATQLRKIVTSLLDNAIKCTDAGAVTVRFGLEGQTPQSKSEGEPRRVFIEVRDTGPGIPARQLESLYRQLEEVDSDENDEQEDLSIGLGLALAARTVRVLGGQLKLESAPDVGTTATVFVPLVEPTEPGFPPSTALWQEPFKSRKAQRKLSTVRSNPPSPPHLSESEAAAAALPAPSPAPPPAPSSASHSSPDAQLSPMLFKVKAERSLSGSHATHATPTRSQTPVLNRSVSLPVSADRLPSVVVPPMRILVVEDDPLCRQILVKRLERDSHEVFTAHHGLEALDIIEDHDFDIVLMDIQMPVMDGLEAIRHIRHRETMMAYSDSPSKHMNGRLPVLAVSAHVEQGWKDVLMKNGFDGHADKPVDVGRLRVILAGVLDAQIRHDNLHRRVGLSPGKWREGGWFYDAPGVPSA